MSQVVELPSGDTIEFPDDFTPERMNEEILKAFPDLKPQGLLSRIGKAAADSTNVRPGFDPWSQWGGKMEVEPGSFQKAFEPPEAVKKAIDKAIPSFEAPTPEVAQLIQMAGLEPARQAAAAVSERIKGALGTVASPGGLGLAVAAPMAPGLVGGVIATTAAPGVVSGVQEAIQGFREGSAGRVAGGLTDTALSGAAVLGGGLGIAKSATTRVPMATAAAKEMGKPKGGIKNAIQERGPTAVPMETPPEVGQKVGAQVRAGEESAIPQKPSGQLGEQVPPKEPLGDVAKPSPVADIESIPATENGGRIAIILPNGKAVVGGRIHADTWNKAIEAGVATDAELSDGFAGFVKTDGTAWGVNGKPLPPVTEVFVVGKETPKPPARPDQRPPEPVNKPAPTTPERAPQAAAPAAAAVSKAKPPGVAAPEAPPAISETTTPVEKIQTGDLFTPQALETPASKTLGIRAPSGSVAGMMDTLKSALRKYGTSRGHLPEEVYALKKDLNATQAATQNSLKVGEKHLMDALAETYGLSALDIAGGGSRKIPVAAVQAMDAYLKGGPGNAIPPRIRGVLDTMRAAIDGASNKMIDTLTDQLGQLPPNSAKAKSLSDLIDTIRGNLDVYVHRSYKYFDSTKKAEKWYSDLPYSVKTAAEDYLMTNSPTPLTRDQAISTLERWLSDLKDEPSFGSATLGSKDLSILMRRKVIAPEIRAVLGEYRSPLVNYAKSVAKASDWVAKQKFLNEVKQRGIGVFLFEDDAAPPGFPAKIAGASSETMSPLNGLRTTHEIADAFREFDAQPEYGALAHTYLMMNAWTKTMATVHSILTQVRNLGSRPIMSGMAGHWQVGKLGRSVRAVLDDFKAKDSPYVQKLYKLGILGDTARWGELQAIIKDAALQDVAPTDLHSWSLTRALKKYGYKIPTEVYRLSDELGNVFGFENERAIQAKIHPSWSAAELDAQTAKITRKLYPFYSETPKFVQSFRKLPFGPFVTFQYQMLRNTWNGIAQSMHEIRSTIPEERTVGYKRLASQAATLTGLWALQEAGKHVLGISSQQEEDFRRFQPPWSKNSKYLFTSKDPKTGELTAINLSFLDPYSGITDPVMAITSAMRTDKDPFEVFMEAMKESVNPWVSEQMLAKALIEARNGKTDEGREIVNPTDEPIEATRKRIEHVLKVFEPGTVQRFQRRILPAIRNEQPIYGRKLEVGPEIARELSGVAIEKFSFKTGLAFRSREFVKSDQAAESLFHKTVSRTQTTTPDDLFEAYKEADSRRFKIWKEFRKDLMAALRNGVPLDEAQKVMVARGVTKADVGAISSGIYMPMKVSGQTMALAKERNRELPIDAMTQYMSTVNGTSLDETQR